MKRGSVVGLVLVLSAVMLFSPVAAASRGPAASPAPDASFLGVVTISTGCTLSTTLAPISVSGSTFTLTAQLNGSLVVLCSGATVNGNNHILNFSTHPGGNSYFAITVNHTSDVTIEDVAISNVSGGVYANDTSGLTVRTMAIQDAVDDGVDVYNSTDVNISNNLGQNGDDGAVYLQNVTGATVNDNNASGTRWGIEAYDSDRVNADRNNVSLNPLGYGIGLDYTNDSNATDNQAFGDEYALWTDDSSNDSFFANTANGTTYFGLYIYAGTDVTATDNVVSDTTEYGGYVDDSSQVTVRGSTATEDDFGLEVSESTDVTLADNNVSFDEYGMELEDGSQLTVTGNSAFESSEDAIYLEYTSGTLISDNHAADSKYAVSVEYDNGTTVAWNDFTNATYAAVYSDEASSNLAILDNDLANSTEYGVYIDEAYGAALVSGNDVAGAQDIGVYSGDSYGSVTVTGNDVLHAEEYGIESDGSYGSLSITDNDVAFGGADDNIYVDGAYGTASVTGNNASNSGDAAIELYETYGATTVAANVATNATDDGVYAYETYGPLTISDNDLAHSPDYGIYSEYATGAANYSGNDIADSDNAIYVYEPYGATSLTDNDVTHSLGGGITIYYAYEGGGVSIQGNNASGSKGDSLYMYETEDFMDPIVDNDLANSAGVYIDDSSYLEIVGNDLLNVSAIDIEDSSLASFDHNDLNTSAFDGNETSMEIGEEYSWNGPYPIGGNYWTGYDGKDLYSGPDQNVVGSDGIGDTPEPVPGASGSVDQYPLMRPWATNPTILKFLPSGLPVTATWTVSVTYSGDGSGSESASGSGDAAVEVPVPYGAATPYQYVVEPVAGFVAAPSAGTGTTGVGTSSVSISFTPFVFNTTFTASGITAGTSWNLTIGGHTYPTTAFTEIVALSNGTYAWSATSKGLSAVSGSTTVAGTSLDVAVAFTAASAPLPAGTFAVVFTEAGISSGSSWSVTFDGSTQTATGTTIVFAVANGTYPYTVATTGSASPQHSSGSVTVAGVAVGVSVLFGSATGIGTTSSPSSGPSWPELYALIAIAVILGLLAVASWMRAMAGRAPPPPPPQAAASAAPGEAIDPAAFSQTSRDAGAPGAPPAAPPSGGWTPPPS